MKCHGCPKKAKHTGPRLREVRTGRMLYFCSLLCRSLFMKRQKDASEYRNPCY